MNTCFYFALFLLHRYTLLTVKHTLFFYHIIIRERVGSWDKTNLLPTCYITGDTCAVFQLRHMQLLILQLNSSNMLHFCDFQCIPHEILEGGTRHISLCIVSFQTLLSHPLDSSSLHSVPSHSPTLSPPHHLTLPPSEKGLRGKGSERNRVCWLPTECFLSCVKSAVYWFTNEPMMTSLWHQVISLASSVWMVYISIDCWSLGTILFLHS